MAHYPRSIRQLVRQIARLPGIGEKTAERLALHLLQVPRREAEELAQAILAMKATVRTCGRCYGLSDDEVCEICRHPGRETGLLCVVEQPTDMVAIEKAGAFRGRYHILQGVLSPMDGVGPDQLRVRELLARIAAETIREVVLATSTSVEGEATADYLAGVLRDRPVQVSRIACGIPMGGDLKYVDQVTLKRAMDSRHAC